MNKEMKFGFPGGFPFIQDVLAHMQMGTKSVATLGRAICTQQGSDYLIVSGCETFGETVTPGVVVVDGEVLPFAGGTRTAGVVIKEIVQPAMFGNGVSRAIYVTRTAAFGNDSEAMAWSAFVRVQWAEYDYVVDSDEKLALLNGNNSATNVLIKRGTWRATENIELASETKNITGENGATLEFNGGAVLSYPYMLSTGSRISNLRFSFNAANENSGGISGFTDVYDCFFDMNSDGDGDDNQTPMIHLCTNVVGCTIKHVGINLKEVIGECGKIVNCVVKGSPSITYLGANEQVLNCSFNGVNYNNAGMTMGCTFNYSNTNNCDNVSNCLFTAKGPYPTGYQGYPMDECRKVLDNHYVGASTNPFRNSYASFIANPGYACADTPAGGFNSIEII